MLKKEPALKDLIEGCVKKDYKCEELLYKTFYGYLSGVVFRYVKQRSSQTELVNDAFLKIFKKIGDFVFNGPPDELPKAFKGWIGRIAANVAIDSIRSKKVLLYVDDIADDKTMKIAVEAPDNLSFQAIVALIDELPPIQQLIFNMHQIEGFSHEEIGKQFQIPPSTSRVYLTRARIKLADLYQKSMMTYYEK
ncbi:MAG: polymerase [Mucilaginibacter sp.]|uniref:RNA polymerase sigma factor n=1 Tax=Mucilaginibacter sp. TaxID=1882438 RepID=UPI002608CB4D|nr:sigma-70 family RNA polymerase sigma factor [Mucilaginibacter sp.]MDB5002411.1 polymerase [Mucilaginibacter sp.]